MRTDIDLLTWNRQHVFASYLGTDFPYINLGCKIDVTNLYHYAKEEGLSFYFTMIYTAMKVADEIENYRYRFKDGQPFVIDHNRAFATHLQPNDDVFVMIDCDDYGNIRDFAKKNRIKADLPVEKNGFPAMAGRYDFINFSSIPWVDYTHFIRTIAAGGVDCNPKMSMGKFSKEDGRILMPFSSQTHHGLMDGLHVGRFFSRLEEYIQDKGWN